MNAEEMASTITKLITERCPPDIHLSCETVRRAVGGVEVTQILVHYIGGNEYLPISTLSAELATLGKVYVEFRGRGAEEASKIVFELTSQDATVQLIYFIDNVE